MGDSLVQSNPPLAFLVGFAIVAFSIVHLRFHNRYYNFVAEFFGASIGSKWYRAARRVSQVAGGIFFLGAGAAVIVGAIAEMVR